MINNKSNSLVALFALVSLFAVPAFANDTIVKQADPQIQGDRKELQDARKEVQEAKQKVVEAKTAGDNEGVQKGKKELQEKRKARHEAREKLRKDRLEKKAAPVAQ